jgi:hypothetical protein
MGVLGVTHGGAADESGTWGYRAGTGTATVTPPGRVIGVTATAATGSPATIIVNGGNTITIPAGTAVDWQPRGVLNASTIVFDSTAGYVVEYLA